jgi:chloramphenicol 3-O phosphotransferase
MPATGWIVLLNGAPRSGKSAIVAALQDGADAPWMNLGVDAWEAVTPPRWRPGVGLRPGGERADLEPSVAIFYAALFESIAAHSRLGLNVVSDLGLHDGYSKPLGVLADAARRLAGLPALLVGVRCPLAVILARRAQAQPGREGRYVAATPDDPVPEPVRRWQAEVHRPGVYDLEVDTSVLTPEQCALAIQARLAAGLPGPSAALERLPAMRAAGRPAADRAAPASGSSG